MGLVVAVLLAGSSALAQRRRGGFRAPIRMATAESFDGNFTFCRVPFSQSNDGDGGSWGVDYPRADANLSLRLAELTRTRINRGADGEPNHVVVRLTDEALFQCPFIMMTEVGSLYLAPEEVEKLREYLSRAASCGSTISGAATPGKSGCARSTRCSPAQSTRPPISP